MSKPDGHTPLTPEQRAQAWRNGIIVALILALLVFFVVKGNKEVSRDRKVRENILEGERQRSR